MEKLNYEISVKEAKQLDSVQKELIGHFKKTQNIRYEEIKQTAFEPIQTAGEMWINEIRNGLKKL